VYGARLGVVRVPAWTSGLRLRSHMGIPAPEGEPHNVVNSASVSKLDLKLLVSRYAVRICRDFADLSITSAR
jgi:hypothetical protein